MRQLLITTADFFRYQIPSRFQVLNVNLSLFSLITFHGLQAR